nr:MAG TPA_asm: hypothetical protein [Caudoviricetes sp.]
MTKHKKFCKISYEICGMARTLPIKKKGVS